MYGPGLSDNKLESSLHSTLDRYFGAKKKKKNLPLNFAFPQ